MKINLILLRRRIFCKMAAENFFSLFLKINFSNEIFAAATKFSQKILAGNFNKFWREKKFCHNFFLIN